ncbi:hypothetical protein KM043_000319 [Ampulex compressa]|nr:hypothetical protein KM043_000319 [Ampulex compressa]
MDYAKFFTTVSCRRKSSMIRRITEAYMETPNSITLASGMPNSGTFPFKEIAVKFKDDGDRVLQGRDLSLSLQYGPTPGYSPLVKKWQEFQKTYHSPKREDWRIAFTVGSQDGCNKIFEMILEEGEPLMMQTPTYTGVLSSVAPFLPDLIEIPQDADGIIPEQIDFECEKRLRDNKPMPKLLYVNPTGANPTGSTLTEFRREQIYTLAQKYNFLILEDDPYYFLHFGDKQPTSFFSLDTDGRVIRLDSFSKILSAGLRLGVVTAHKDIINKLIVHIENTVLHTSSLSQMLLYKLFEIWQLNQFQSHFNDVRKFYQEKRDIMLVAIEKHLSGLAEWSAPTGGMFVWIKITGIDNVFDLVVNKCVQNKLFVLPGHAFNYVDTKPDQHIRICYSYATPEEIDTGLSILARLIQEEIKVSGISRTSNAKPRL